MANSPSARKRIRTNNARTEINGARAGRIRTFVKRVENAIAAGDKETATSAFKEAMPEMQRGVTRGILHKNTVSRKLSRMSAGIKKLA
jgi:small subunit ribosomal protein S20